MSITTGISKCLNASGSDLETVSVVERILGSRDWEIQVVDAFGTGGSAFVTRMSCRNCGARRILVYEDSCR